VRAPALVLLAVLGATGATLAAPVGVLEVSDGRAVVLGRLDDGEPFAYSYIQSVYNVVVVEEQERAGDMLRMDRARSADIKALEYFRWPGTIRESDGSFVQDAPFWEAPELRIRITAPNAQTLRTARWSLDLPARFGETVVTVRPLSVPWAVALLRSR
jgi:hypothetical protein